MSLTSTIIIFITILIIIRALSKNLILKISKPKNTKQNKTLDELVSSEELRLRALSSTIKKNDTPQMLSTKNNKNRYLELLKEKKSSEIIEINKEVLWGNARIIEETVSSLKISGTILDKYRVQEICSEIFNLSNLGQLFFQKKITNLQEFKKLFKYLVKVDHLLATRGKKLNSKISKINSKTVDLFFNFASSNNFSYEKAIKCPSASSNIKSLNIPSLENIIIKDLDKYENRLKELENYAHALIKLDESDRKEIQDEIKRVGIKQVLKSFHPDTFSYLKLKDKNLKITAENFNLIKEI